MAYRNLVLKTLIGFALAILAITAYTAGVYIELMLTGLVLSGIMFIFQIITQTNWIWRIIYVGILILHTEYFLRPGIVNYFTASNKSIYLSPYQVDSLQWIAPISAGICLSVFWIELISTIRKKEKTLPNNG